MANPHPSNGFQKNQDGKKDPRINRRGRPKEFDAVRELAQQVAHAVAQVGEKDLVIDGHKVTIVEAILRQWATSKVPALQQAFMAYAFGKVPDNVDITSKGEKIESLNNVPYDERLRRIAEIVAEAQARGTKVVNEGGRLDAGSPQSPTDGGVLERHD